MRPHTPTLCAAALCVAAAPQLGSGSIEFLQIAFVVVFVVISLALHEAAHAWVAWKCGDPTAKDLGRITLNPLPSIDPFMTILVPGMLLAMGLPAFGGAKPVPVSYHRLRHPLRDMMLVALAGPATNFLLSIVFLLGLKVAVNHGDYREGDLLFEVLRFSLFANLALTTFNLIPVPPLDGSRVMAWLLPPGLREPYQELERFGLLLVLALVTLLRMVPSFDGMIMSGSRQLFEFVDLLTGGTW
ncbi:MAG: site-2 protease family protein [Planctomycetes bacterium]|nr:site-2 protease family protein [Planctomycetota bacterium]